MNMNDPVSLPAAARQRLRLRFPAVLDAALSVRDCPADAISLAGPSSYLLKTGGDFWAIDLALRHEFQQAPLAERRAALRQLRFHLLSHGHVDHFDPFVLRLLQEEGVVTVAPDFLEKPLRDAGVTLFRTVAAGETVTVGSVTLTAFESLHFRRSNGGGVKELGYLAEANGRRLLFPGDVRNYDAARLPDFCRGADRMAAHLWLGDGNATDRGFPLLAAFTRFITDLAPSSVMITHLLESGREPDGMWSFRHAGLAADRLLRSAPEIEVTIPAPGGPTLL